MDVRNVDLIFRPATKSFRRLVLASLYSRICCVCKREQIELNHSAARISKVNMVKLTCSIECKHLNTVVFA